MSRNREIAEFLSLLSSYIEDATSDDMAKLKRFLSQRSNLRRVPKKSRLSHSSRKWDGLAKRLTTYDTRQKGLDALARMDLTRRELEEFAKTNDVHVVKTDNAERISEKIIEAFIGSRLSSDAVRGTHPQKN